MWVKGFMSMFVGFKVRFFWLFCYNRPGQYTRPAARPVAGSQVYDWFMKW